MTNKDLETRNVEYEKGTELSRKLNCHKLSRCVACDEPIGKDRNHHCDEKWEKRIESHRRNYPENPAPRKPSFGERLEQGFYDA